MSTWIKTLKRTINGCFTKVRVSMRKKKALSCKNFRNRKQAILSNNISHRNKAEDLLRREEAKSNMDTIYNNFNIIKRSKNHQSSIWKVKNKIFPKLKAPLPVAKRNLAGKIITNSGELKKLYLKHFHHRMRDRPILKQYES